MCRAFFVLLPPLPFASMLWKLLILLTKEDVKIADFLNLRAFSFDFGNVRSFSSSDMLLLGAFYLVLSEFDLKLSEFNVR